VGRESHRSVDDGKVGSRRPLLPWESGNVKIPKYFLHIVCPVLMWSVVNSIFTSELLLEPLVPFNSTLLQQAVALGVVTSTCVTVGLTTSTSVSLLHDDVHPPVHIQFLRRGDWHSCLRANFGIDTSAEFRDITIQMMDMSEFSNLQDPRVCLSAVEKIVLTVPRDILRTRDRWDRSCDSACIYATGWRDSWRGRIPDVLLQRRKSLGNFHPMGQLERETAQVVCVCVCVCVYVCVFPSCIRYIHICVCI
jgi:hypothetical protein